MTAGVVDARAPGADASAREAVGAALLTHDELRLVLGAPLTSALAGEPDPSARDLALAEVEAAQRAYGQLDCQAAGAAAERAARALLVLDVFAARATALERALALLLLCAHSQGDRAAAQAHAGRLRALRGTADPPEGVAQAVWDQVPEIDAGANLFLAPVRVETDPAGAEVSIDLAPAAPAPVEVALRAGRHWLVASAPGRARTFTVIDVADRRAAAVHVALAPIAEDAWAALRARVAAVRAGAALDDAFVTSTMRDAGLAVAVVLSGDRAHVYALAAGDAAARHVTDVPLASTNDLAARAAEAARPTPATPVAPPPPPPGKKRKWFYVAAAGAAVVLLGIVVFSEAPEGTQRIEVGWP